MINATGNRMTLEIRRQAALANGLARTQVEISTGKRIQQGSDDPIASARIASIRRAVADDAAWMANLDLGLSLASQADTVVNGIADNMARALELVVSAANDTLSSDDRVTIARELESIAQQIEAFGETRSSQDEPLFLAGPHAYRFSSTASFAPVPDFDAVFGTAGINLSQTIRNAAGAVTAGTAVAISDSLTAIEAGVSHVADVAADIGVRAARLERMRETYEERAIDLAVERSGLEDTDLTSAIARLNAQTLTLDAAQAAFARINRRTLFDILG
jgi:flagellar hook-associated protein 3 FlgL